MAGVRRRARPRLDEFTVDDDMSLSIGPSPRIVGEAATAELDRLRRLWNEHGVELLRTAGYPWAIDAFGLPHRTEEGGSRAR